MFSEATANWQTPKTEGMLFSIQQRCARMWTPLTASVNLRTFSGTPIIVTVVGPS